MKTIIAGSRGITDYRLVEEAVEKSGFQISQVFSGAARGIDSLGEKWAELHKIPVRQFRPDWEGLGRCAGIIRNHAMADEADALVAIWDGKSRGTGHMIKAATKNGLKVHVYRTD